MPSPPQQLPAAAALTARPWARGVLRSLAGVYVRAVLMGGARRVRCIVVTLSQALQQHDIE